MTKAEEAALRVYPKKDYNKEPNYLHTCDSEMLDRVYRDVFMLGYKQAEKETIDRAIGVLKNYCDTRKLYEGTKVKLIQFFQKAMED